jgi:predicted RNase H-like HicB family nuclease
MSYVKPIITIRGNNLKKHQITYWQDGEFWLGYINEFPEYTSQGLTLDELIINLKDIYNDVTNELIPGKRKTMELEFS